jgi:pentatricopeptide repeat domain-containing protein 1
MPTTKYSENGIKTSATAADFRHKFFNWADVQPGFSYHSCTYHAMIGILGKEKRYEDILALLKSMRKRDRKVTAEIYIGLARSYGSAGLLEKATEALNRLKDVGFTPSVAAYNSLIDALAKAGFRRKALAVYKVMGQSWFQPDTYTFNNLMLSRTQKTCILFASCLKR